MNNIANMVLQFKYMNKRDGNKRIFYYVNVTTHANTQIVLQNFYCRTETMFGVTKTNSMLIEVVFRLDVFHVSQ